MTKDVLISITGMQTQDTGEAVEIINTGTYYLKNGMHYILYDEVMEGFEQITKNKIKFKEGYLCVSKKGVLNSNLEYDLSKKTLSCYVTPYGEMMMGIQTNLLDISEDEDEITVIADYALDVNYQFLSDCHIRIVIHPKEKGIKL